MKRLAEVSGEDFTINTVELDIILRIKKCLNRANHPNTPEAEAKAAVRMSSRLMEQHNVRQADLIAAEVKSDGPSTLSGQSRVNVSKAKPGARIVIENWVSTISSAMQIFFDCKAYTTRCKNSIEWTFYGIATNTVAAAMAFEMVHNLVQDWSSRRKGNKNSYRLGVASGLRRIADREKEDEARRVREQAAKDLAVKEAEEDRQRQAEIDRLSRDALPFEDVSHNNPCAWLLSPSVKVEKEPEILIKDEREGCGTVQASSLLGVLNESYEDEGDTTDDDLDDDTDTNTNSSLCDGDSDVDDISGMYGATFDEEDEPVVDIAADFEEELKRHMPKREPSPPASWGSKILPPPELDDQNSRDKQSGMLWRDIGALVLFRENAQKIAEDYLKAKNVKPRKSRKRKNDIKDWTAYRAGKEDSKKIDVKRRRIEG